MLNNCIHVIIMAGPEYERMESFSNPMAPPEIVQDEEVADDQ